MEKSYQFEQSLKQSGAIFKKDEPLAGYSTLQVGGPARFLLITENSKGLKEAVCLAQAYQIPFLIIGKGSNVIFSDYGYDGLVIINVSRNWQILKKEVSVRGEIRHPSHGLIRTDSGFEPESRQEARTDKNHVLVRAESGVAVNYLLHALYKQGICGLEWFAGIPATIGGALYMNMHGGAYFFGNLLETATLLSGQKLKSVKKDYFAFTYDNSILHHTKEIVLDATLRLHRGDINEAKKLSDKWAAHKALQPRRSAGCIFQNLTDTEQKRLNLPGSSTGYLIDKVLNLKGKRIGDAVISEKHAAFIENLGGAKAQDVFTLMQLIKEQAALKLGLMLKEEVQLIGRF